MSDASRATFLGYISQPHVAMRYLLVSPNCSRIRLTVTDQSVYKQLSSQPGNNLFLPQDDSAHYRPLPAAEATSMLDYAYASIVVAAAKQSR